MADDVHASGGIAAPAAAGVSGASPATQAPISSANAAPAVQGSEGTGSTDNTAEREGFIPRARFDEVNGRMTTAEKSLSDWKAQHGWAESVNREQMAQMANWYGRYTGDAGEFIETILQESLAHPVHGASVKSRLGRMLSSLRQQPTEAQAPIEPGIPVMDAQGNVVARTFTDEQIREVIQRSVAEALGREVDPLKKDFATRQEQAKAQHEHDQIVKETQRIKRDILKYPEAEARFKEIQDAARELIQADPDISVGEAMRDAYFKLVYPTLGQKAQDTVLSDLQRKATAQTVTPGMPTGSAKPKFKNFEEAATYYAQHPEEAAAMAQR